jgi:hypothetical protein
MLQKILIGAYMLLTAQNFQNQKKNIWQPYFIIYQSKETLMSNLNTKFQASLIQIDCEL